MPITETLIAIKNKAILSLLGKGTGWLKSEFIKRVNGNKPTKEEIEAFFETGLSEHKAKGILESLVNELVNGLQPRFEESGLDKTELEAVRSYLELLIDRMEISSSLTEQYGYNPGALSEYTASLPTSREMQGFSESQQLLIREVLRDLGTPLLQLAFELPTSVMRLNDRFDELRSIVAEILVNVMHIRAAAEASNPADDIAEFEQAYRSHLSQSLDHMELLGLDEVRQSLRRYPLEDSFVHLRVVSNDRKMSLVKALETHKKIFLMGTAGSGKTTLSRWLAIMLSRDMFDKISSLSGKFPFIITLRDFNDKELPKNLTDMLGNHLFLPPVSTEKLEHVLHKRLKSGRALVLIDGVDEVAESRIGEVKQWVKRLIEAYPKALFVISSRPVINLANWLGLQKTKSSNIFTTTFVETMSEEELENLVQRWHRVAAKAADDPSINAKSVQLLAKIQNESGLRELASTPLLASAICALNLEAAGGLPIKPHELYEGLIRMMIEKRDRQRNIDFQLSLSLEQKLVIISSIAARIVWHNDVRISREELMAEVKNRLAMSDRRIDPDKVFLFLVGRTGLLKQVDQDRFEFVHKTFQEFLSARHFVSTSDYSYVNAFLMSRQAGDIAYFMAVLAPNAGTVILRMMHELLRDRKNPYSTVNYRKALHLIARSVEDSVTIDLETSYKIAEVFAKVKGIVGWYKWKEREIVEHRLSSKIDLSDID